MSRIKIELPQQFQFSTTIRIRITDLNYGGHVGNDSFLSLVHEARQLFLQSLGYSELNLGGVGLIMADAGIEFKSEIHAGDDVRISVAATGCTRIGFDLYYLLEIIRPEESVIAGKVKTGMICFDYSLRKVSNLPAEVRARLEG